MHARCPHPFFFFFLLTSLSLSTCAKYSSYRTSELLIDRKSIIFSYIIIFYSLVFNVKEWEREREENEREMTIMAIAEQGKSKSTRKLQVTQWTAKNKRRLLIQILTRRDMPSSSSSSSYSCCFLSLCPNHNIIFAATNDIIVSLVTIK